MENDVISQSEFDLVDFLRDLFPRVIFGLPKLGRDEANWKLTYVALYGLNEIAQHFDDRVDLEICAIDDRVLYQVHSRMDDLKPLYREIITIVEDGDIEDIIERRALDYLGHWVEINHNQNLEAIDMLLAFDANNAQDLPEELLDAEDLILFGSASDAMISEAEAYLYEVSMPGALGSGGVYRPRRGIEISKLPAA